MIYNEKELYSTQGIEYMKENDTRCNHRRHHDISETPMSSNFPVFKYIGKLVGTTTSLSVKEWQQVHKYVLENSDAIFPYISEHKQLIQNMGVHNIEVVHDKFFLEWLESRVVHLHKQGKVDDELLSLARGPDKEVLSFTGIDINGFRFHAQDRDNGLTTQNSGVHVKVESTNGPFSYYGVLDEFLELRYTGGKWAHIFRCEWWGLHNQGRGFERDKYDFFSLNTKRKLKNNEPFMLASQAEQCFYADDLSRSNWVVVIESPPRDLYNVTYFHEGDEDVIDDKSAFQENTYNSHADASFPSDAFDVHHWKRHCSEDLVNESCKKTQMD